MSTMDLEQLRVALEETMACPMSGRPSDTLPAIDWNQDAMVGYSQNIPRNFDYSRPLNPNFVTHLQRLPTEILLGVLDNLIRSNEPRRPEHHRGSISVARLSLEPLSLPDASTFQTDAWKTCIDPWGVQRIVDLDFPTEFHREEYAFMLKKGKYEYFTMNEYQNIEGFLERLRLDGLEGLRDKVMDLIYPNLVFDLRLEGNLLAGTPYQPIHNLEHHLDIDRIQHISLDYTAPSAIPHVWVSDDAFIRLCKAIARNPSLQLKSVTLWVRFTKEGFHILSGSRSIDKPAYKQEAWVKEFKKIRPEQFHLHLMIMNDSKPDTGPKWEKMKGDLEVWEPELKEVLLPHSLE